MESETAIETVMPLHPCGCRFIGKGLYETDDRCLAAALMSKVEELNRQLDTCEASRDGWKKRASENESKANEEQLCQMAYAQGWLTAVAALQRLTDQLDPRSPMGMAGANFIEELKCSDEYVAAGMVVAKSVVR
jgi:hypothetical protein